jgi:outer membrane protein TolC
VARAEIETRQAGARITALRAEIANDVLHAWLAYTTARTQLDALEQQMLVQAREVREATAYSYGRGEASFIELLDAQRTFNEITQSYNAKRERSTREVCTRSTLPQAASSHDYSSSAHPAGVAAAGDDGLQQSALRL